MLKRLFSAQYPIQCNLVNNLDSDPELSSNLVAMLATRYTDLPSFLTLKIPQKKKKDKIFSEYEDCVLEKYMEINEIGMRELEEAYVFDEKTITKTLDLIKKNFFNTDDCVILEKLNKKATKNKKEETLF